MAYNIQICVDCTHALNQADWWAETLKWAREPTDQEVLQSALDQGLASPTDVVEHHGVRVWGDVAAICPPDQVGRRGRLRILFQTVPEPKTVKDRIHLDVILDDMAKEEARPRLEQRGATFLYEASQGPQSWYTMADPEGNEFCIG
ncbi:VOC family protein [Arthrobacter sp. zg-Y1171]|uniref:VOC family protein n=1 Tax=Arthrobacter sp. zg-Y1171 TaxID=2964610 RepID=UPI0021026317|nr:VOC family protein [Arthrobacter sp. zg-Y1171]MCQ1994581.1 VOC family protein [Arthrobacter sp. zg-Y1171]UWX81339.1 VOC family protein [Arthrobacter sp. zg-Y1171]